MLLCSCSNRQSKKLSQFGRQRSLCLQIGEENRHGLGFFSPLSTPGRRRTSLPILATDHQPLGIIWSVIKFSSDKILIFGTDIKAYQVFLKSTQLEDHLELEHAIILYFYIQYEKCQIPN